MKKEQQNNIYDLKYLTWPFHHSFFSHRQQMDRTKIPSCLNTLRAFTDIAFCRVTFVLHLLKHPFSLCWTHPRTVYLGSTEYSCHILQTLGFASLLVSLSSLVMGTWALFYSFTGHSAHPDPQLLVMFWFFFGPLPISFIVLFPPKLLFLF